VLENSCCVRYRSVDIGLRDVMGGSSVYAFGDNFHSTEKVLVCLLRC
jgi:hypothetical protein